jgi:hypothetical protein
MIDLYQQRDFGEKINVTFQYVGQQMRSLGLALLYIAGPVALLTGIASGIFQTGVKELTVSNLSDESSGTGLMSSYLALFSGSGLFFILFSLISSVIVSLVTYGHLRVYARTNGGPVEVSAVWAEVQDALGRSVLVSLLAGLLVLAGFMLLFIPGIYVSVPLSLALVITMFESTAPATTISRCFAVIRGNWWSTLGLILVMAIVVSIISLIFTVPAGIVSAMNGAGLLPESGSSIITTITQTIATFGSGLLASVLHIATAFQYFSLTERQEGTGLLSAIDSIGTSPTKPRADDEGEY